MERLPPKILDWLKKNAFSYPNVIGYSMIYEPKIKKGVVTKEQAVRFYVSRKVDEKYLIRVIPKEFAVRERIFKKLKVVTDVIEKEQPRAFWPGDDTIDKTARFRPVELSVSIGNARITAGSLGMLYTYHNELVAGSNAHIVTPNAGMSVEEIIASGDVDILQPGSAHNGTIDDKVGTYLWHQQVVPMEIPSDCEVAKVIVWALNCIARLFGRQTRLAATVQGINTIDFGVYKPTVKHLFKFADNSINPEERDFIGHLFAGSTNSGIICKISEIIKACPVNLVPLSLCTGVDIGDKVRGSSFWCNYTTEVTDPAAVITVGYGNFTALFENVIMVKNEDVIRGGWSGSGWFKIDHL